jgi:Flp pilus assembly protein TadG
MKGHPMACVKAIRERGAAAVEMAIVLPLLLLLIGGLIDFGRLFYDRALLTNAARDGVRLASIQQDSTTVVVPRTKSAAAPRSVNVAVSADPTTCLAPSTISVTVTPATPFKWTMLDVIPSLVGGTVPAPSIKGEATMSCA